MSEIQDLELKYLAPFKEDKDAEKRKEEMNRIVEKLKNIPGFSRLFYFYGTLGDCYLYDGISYGDRVLESFIGDYALLIGDITLPILKEDVGRLMAELEEVENEKQRVETETQRTVHLDIDKEGCTSIEIIKQKLMDKIQQEEARNIAEKKQELIDSAAREKERLERIEKERLGQYENETIKINDMTEVILKADPERFIFREKLTVWNDTLYSDTSKSLGGVSLSRWSMQHPDRWIDWIVDHKKGCKFVTKRGDELKICFDDNKVTLNDKRVSADKLKHIILAFKKNQIDIEKYYATISKLGIRKSKLCDMTEIEVPGVGKNSERVRVPVTITAIDENNAIFTVFNKNVTLGWDTLLRHFMSGNRVYCYVYDAHRFFGELNIPSEEFIEGLKEARVLQKL